MVMEDCYLSYIYVFFNDYMTTYNSAFVIA